MKYTCSLGIQNTHGVVSSNQVYGMFILFVTVLNFWGRYYVLNFNKLCV